MRILRDLVTVLEPFDQVAQVFGKGVATSGLVLDMVWWLREVLTDLRDSEDESGEVKVLAEACAGASAIDFWRGFAVPLSVLCRGRRGPRRRGIVAMNHYAPRLTEDKFFKAERAGASRGRGGLRCWPPSQRRLLRSSTRGRRPTRQS